MQPLTQLLDRAAAGDPQAAEQLLPLVYDELRKLAAARLSQEKPGQTLQATALVHEAYLRLVGGAVGNALRGVPGVGSQESGVGDAAGEFTPTPDARLPTPATTAPRRCPRLPSSIPAAISLPPRPRRCGES